MKTVTFFFEARHGMGSYFSHNSQSSFDTKEELVKLIKEFQEKPKGTQPHFCIAYVIG